MNDLEMCDLLANYSKEISETEGLGAKGLVQIKHARIIRTEIVVNELRFMLRRFHRKSFKGTFFDNVILDRIKEIENGNKC